MKRIVLLMSVLLFLLTGCGEKIPCVEVTELKERQLEKTFQSDGYIKSDGRTVSVLSDMKDVKVADVYVSVGETVKKGDVICRFESADIESKIDALISSINAETAQHEANLKYYQSVLSSEENSKQNKVEVFNYELAQQEDILNSLTNELNAISETRARLSDDSIEMAELNIKYDELNQKIKETKDSIELMKLDHNMNLLESDRSINQAGLNLRFCELENLSDDENELKKLNSMLSGLDILAPCDGVVTVLYAAKGDKIEKNKVAEIQTDKQNKIVTYVSDKYILNIDSGDEVSYIVGSDNNTYKGKVEKVSSVKDEKGYEIVIESVESYAYLSGMQVDITFTLNSETGLCVLNTDIYKDTDDSKYILKLKRSDEKTGIIEKIPVECGISNNLYSVVENNNGLLADGDYILTGATNIGSGMTVEYNVWEDYE